MKKINPFFQKKEKIYLYDILKILNISNIKKYKNLLIKNIQNLELAEKDDITFFHSLKYKDATKVSKSNFIITCCHNYDIYFCNWIGIIY